MGIGGISTNKMFIHNLNPVLAKLGPFEIRWYGVIFALGFIIAFLVLLKTAEKKKLLNFKKDDAYSLLLYLLIGIIIFSRLFEIIFYNLGYYINHPLEVFAVWHGGLSFHGGLVGAVIVALVFAKKKKVRFYDLADLLSIPAAIGLAFGRIGNFINGELWGTVTNLPWCVKFKGAEGCRHPSQLYESAKNFIVFFVLLALNKKQRKPGFIFWHFILLYGIGRFLTDFY
ncbi:prolipoprotein diacylglyceryl transferase, partial [Candidatus Woesearchaeota archaeon]|nr:prolipoprotein diacylglyceryl transferase [Candidatus Woesearchaeota archaeon]